jgi:hypothetical protein
MTELRFCGCGCGERVRDKRSTYLRNHHNRNKPLTEGEDYEVRDMGYQTPCHLWLKRIDDAGYGRVSRGGVTSMRAHIFNYVLKHGPVPDDFELDHLCRVKCCMNDDHLEVVTHAENVRRAQKIRWDRELGRA